MKLFTLALLTLGVAFGQAVYIEPPPAMTVAGNPPPGSFPALLAASGARISICDYPSCSALSQTYTDATAGTPCPTNTQVVIAGTSTCTNAADSRGNFGFWVLTGGQYEYKITLRNGTIYGPYPVTMQTNNAANVQLVGLDGLPHTVQNLTDPAIGSNLLVATKQNLTGAGTRAAGDKLNDLVNVADFVTLGASFCNGVVDDTAVLQAAIDSGAKVLNIPRGTCKHTGLVVYNKEGFTIQGAGSGQGANAGTRLVYTGSLNGVCLEWKSNRWSVLRDLYMDCGNAGYGVKNWADMAVASSQKNRFINLGIRMFRKASTIPSPFGVARRGSTRTARKRF